jgi:DNA polymerase I-like protein with 3'-5' exonuclease and polymerase domains
MLVHDSVLIEAPEDRWKEVGEHCLNLMPHIAESRLNADIPFEVDVEVGKRWGELKEVDLQ